MSTNPENVPNQPDRPGEEEGNALVQSGSNTPKAKLDGTSLDDVYDKIGFGSYQTRLTINMGLVAFSEGAQIIVSTLNLTILQNVWALSDFQVSLMASLFFLGVLLGSAFAGYFADVFGRYKPILISLCLMAALNFVSAFSWNLTSFIIFRTLLGFFMGFFGPLGFTMLTENVPSSFRGKIVMVANGFLFCGELFACLLAFVTLGNLVDGDWRLLTMVSTVGFLVPIALNIIFLEESIRYRIVMGNDFNDVFTSIKGMIELNGSTYQLTEEDQIGLITWQANLANQVTNEDVASIKALFKKDARTTVIVWMGWFNNSFVYYGIVLFFPYILSHISEASGAITTVAVANPSDLASITISTAVESCSVILAYFIIDSTPGRKGTMQVFYILTGFAALAAFFDSSRVLFIIWVTATKIFINVVSFYFYLYTLEFYPTKYRATGVGMAAAVGKSGAIFMPWICMLLISIDLLLPFMLFAIMCFAMAAVLLGLPMDTKDQQLM